ncbi:MAG TPA: GNAT family N-acetyltransferase [Anaerolineales bacterium]|nr:GNAT family N-acetyltransferase [Anaerolineales bacterium]
MVKLIPLTQKEFDDFLEHDIRVYAQERTQAGFWSEAEAITRSRKEHKALLPDGLRSRYHHLYTIRESEQGEALGVLWLKTDFDTSRATGFIFDIEIHEPHRRKGFAREAMHELENVSRGMGLRQLGLHVFAHNEAARALYEELGYQVASMNMLKDI